MNVQEAELLCGERREGCWHGDSGRHRAFIGAIHTLQCCLSLSRGAYGPLPTMVLPFPNPPYFHVFIMNNKFIFFFYPSASHCWGRADGDLCEPHEWRVDGKGEATRRCWWGGAARRVLWARLIAWRQQGMARGFPHPSVALMVPAACRAMSLRFASQEGPGALQPS